jgi:hypothetical protein
MKYIIEVIAEKIVHGVVLGLVFLLPAVAMAVPSGSIPTQVNVGFVTCIPNTTGAAGCLNNSAATSAQWRVINNFASPTDFLDATLTFDYTGGEPLVWSWDVIHPTTGPGSFVETSSFPISLIPSFESLTFTATLGRTTFDPLSDGPSNCCLDGQRYTEAFFADSATFSSDTTAFPPPLALTVPGTLVDTLVPTPEPMTLLLVAVPMLLARRFCTNLKRDGGGVRP